VRALIIASSPDQHRKDYLTKLYKLRDKSVDDTVEVSPIDQARQQIEQIKADGAQVARVYFLKFGNRSMASFKQRIKEKYPGFTITLTPATEQDVKAFTAQGHGVSTSTKQIARENPENLLVATAVLPGSTPAAPAARRYIDLTDGQAGSFDDGDGYTRLGVYWGQPGDRIEAGSPESQQLIKDIVKNLKTTSKKK
jgi:hypothetical protein